MIPPQLRIWLGIVSSAPNLNGVTAVGGNDGALEERCFGTGSKQDDICNFLRRRLSRHGHAVDSNAVVGDVCGEWCAGGTVNMLTAYILVEDLTRQFLAQRS